MQKLNPKYYHGIQAVGAGLIGILGMLAEHAAILPPKVGMVVTGLSLVVAAFSKKPGTPKAP